MVHKGVDLDEASEDDIALFLQLLEDGELARAYDRAVIRRGESDMAYLNSHMRFGVPSPARERTDEDEEIL